MRPIFAIAVLLLGVFSVVHEPDRASRLAAHVGRGNASVPALSIAPTPVKEIEKQTSETSAQAPAGAAAKSPPAVQGTALANAASPSPQPSTLSNNVAAVAAVDAVSTPPRVLPPTRATSPPAAKRPRRQFAYNNPQSTPNLKSHIAIYDIAAHTVFLPDGEQLEAHSGLGPMLDRARYANVKGRGPTPPNVYDLTLRSGLFHGVQAIRLKPVAGSRMYGRDGFLAHTYMLGPSGESFGCVSFKDYSKFLDAFMRGEINRMVVVPHMAIKPPVDRVPSSMANRYAFNEGSN
jgi:hypothetical protein